MHSLATISTGKQALSARRTGTHFLFFTSTPGLILLAGGDPGPTGSRAFLLCARLTRRHTVFVDVPITIVVDAIPTDLFGFLGRRITGVATIVDPVGTIVVDTIPADLLIQVRRRITRRPSAIHTYFDSLVTPVEAVLDLRSLTGGANATAVNTTQFTRSWHCSNTAICVYQASILCLTQPIAQTDKTLWTIGLLLAVRLTFPEIADLASGAIHVIFAVLDDGFVLFAGNNAHTETPGHKQHGKCPGR
jgi:hypothetical protein